MPAVPATIIATPPITTGVDVPAVTRSATAPIAVTNAPPTTKNPPATMPAIAPLTAAFSESISPLSLFRTPLSPPTLLFRFVTTVWKLPESTTSESCRPRITRRVLLDTSWYFLASSRSTASASSHCFFVAPSGHTTGIV